MGHATNEDSDEDGNVDDIIEVTPPSGPFATHSSAPPSMPNATTDNGAPSSSVATLQLPPPASQSPASGVA